MPTIKDIAREAGVSQGTVSNVLNGKGNVSSVKIRQVQQAAERLGYAMNQRAQVLRRGSSNVLAAVLPSLYSRTYVDFFTSFRICAQERGYQVSLHLTDDQPEKERRALEEIQTSMMAGAAVFTALADGGAAYAAAGVKNVCFVERAPGDGAPVLAFDFYQLGCNMARQAIADGCARLALISENAAFSSQIELTRGLRDTLGAAHLPLALCATDSGYAASDVFDVLDASPAPDGVFVANYAVAQTVRGAVQHFVLRRPPRIYAAAPLFTLPNAQCTEFELNYRLLGRRAAERLIDAIEGKPVSAESVLLPPDGLRTWQPVRGGQGVKRLTLATLDTSSARALRHISQLYTRQTGVEIHFAAYTYNGLNEVLDNIENTAFDAVRLDSTHWNRYTNRIFAPLKEIDPDIERIFDSFVPGISREYSHRGDTLYALPHTPSTQLLFYRKDLFESTAFRRQYRELYGAELLPPTTYAEYNRIARFFTRTFNPDSPVPFGTGLMLGNASMAAKEFLSRYFAHSEQLYDEKGHILLDSPLSALAMQEMIALRECIDRTRCDSWRDTLTSFTEGGAAMSIVYSNFTSNITSTRSRISHRIGYAAVPGGHPMLGGSTIGVCRVSRHKEEALRFLRWLCSEEVSTALALMGTTSPCRKTYENYEVMDRCPWLLMAKDCFISSHTSYRPPQIEGDFDDARFLGILSVAVNSAFSGAMPVEEALRFAKLTFDKAFCGG